MVKSSSKKDRHSKINTARGPRDRRMRLSLDVAKKFFRLQDILGFDKASNTIDWLLVNSKPAIQALLINPQQLIDGSRSNIASSAYNSEGEEVVSGIIINDDQSAAASTEDQQVILINKAKFSNKDKLKKIDSTTGGVIRKSVCMNQHQYDHSLAIAKETRAKARARARKRTSEKKINNIKLTAAAGSCTVVGTDQCYNSKLIIRPIMSTLDQQVTNLDKKLNPIGSWIPLGSENNCQAATDDQAAAAGSNYFQFKQAAGININVGDIDSSCSVMSSSNSWSPSFLFNYQHNPAAAAGPSHDQHDHQFSEFQMISKPWE